MRLAAVLPFVALILSGAAAVSAQQPASAPAADVVVIHAGTLLDRPGRAPRRNVSIVVRGDRIESVQDGFVPAPEGARLIDLSDRFVLPGLIDSHVHLDSDRAGVEGTLAAVTDNVALTAHEAAWNARKTLRAGFTTVRNLGSSDGVTLGLRDAISRGWAIGPRIVDAGTSLSATTGHMDPTLGVREEFHDVLRHSGSTCDGPDDCRRAVRRQIARGVDVIKIATTGGVNSRIGLGLGAQMFEDEARAIVETAHLYGKRVAVHAHGADGINLALRVGADSIEHGTLIDDESLRLFRQTNAYYVPTLSTVNGYIERMRANPNAYTGEVREKIEWRISITGQALRRAVPAGVRIAFGTDAGVSMHGRNADEFLLMVEHGMTPMSAIQAATVNAADLLGLADQVGTIEPGKSADIVAVRGDPLSDVGVLRQMNFVMARGRVHRQEP
ncbi:amidohydrolase family protein [Sphingosinicella sp. LHD-64]|uniref:metal-dependent hydrolase family protein n=1 Tax=Sphingosinicella sp. LHD-64 TaxID=3072139 RepID=UPI00280F795E|nr:amidohydrolase family protein [Sphingosinicella sp. LHD-64]MDQ8755770.1 amidohydrolase family protein [Sphingosinicella sp. LHD-64]